MREVRLWRWACGSICRWRVYHLEREFARAQGDPCIGTVWASSQEEAEAKANHAFYAPTGVLVQEDRDA